MLNKKLNRLIFSLLILSHSVLFVNAEINAGNLNNNDSSVKSPITTSLIRPEVPLHPSMEGFVTDYAEDYEKLFENLKNTKSGYLKTIDKVFKQLDIPLELKYMAIVESQLKIDARSGVGAVGLWQFMPATAKRFGLKITEKNDDRKHVWKSSVAAAKYMLELYDIFGDWLLVIASYNSGPAPVLNAIKKTGSRNFWTLQNHLPKETRNHVKRFIATHYYFEGKGSLVTIGKTESEKYLKQLEEFNAKNQNADTRDEPADSIPVYSKLVAIINNENDLTFILRK